MFERCRTQFTGIYGFFLAIGQVMLTRRALLYVGYYFGPVAEGSLFEQGVRASSDAPTIKMSARSVTPSATDDEQLACGLDARS
jgi:hypothetical protein